MREVPHRGGMSVPPEPQSEVINALNCRVALGDKSATAVDLAAVVDREDDDNTRLVVDLIDESVVATVRAVLALQLEAKLVADAPWVVGESSVGELDNGRADLLGQS